MVVEYIGACDFCGREIEHNEKYFSINLTEERFISDNEIEVDDAVQLLALCHGCGSKIRNTTDIIMNIINLKEESEKYIDMLRTLYSIGKKRNR